MNQNWTVTSFDSHMEWTKTQVDQLQLWSYTKNKNRDQKEQKKKLRAGHFID